MEDKLRTFLTGRFGEKILSEYTHRGQLSFYVQSRALRDIAVALKDDAELKFEFLTDITAVDHQGRPWENEGRFELVYILTSLKNTFQFMLRTKLPEDAATAPTLSHDWSCANWLEREVWDLMGVRFEGHPDLTKIVTDDELEGHPLRKDFGITYEMPQFSHNSSDIEIVPDNPHH
jgi:NADH-quinone oxidoreductase subunit C